MAIKWPKKRAFSLIELIIYFAISSMALGIIVSMFAIAQRTQRHTYSQYLVGGSVASTIRLIRRELQATALSSIRVYPEDGGGVPGFSVVSAYDDDGKFEVNGYGAPAWRKHVGYSLVDGSLMRWSNPIVNPDFLPIALAGMPAQIGQSGRGVMSGLLKANTKVEGHHDASEYGGLELSFVRRKDGVDSLTKINPVNSKAYAEHTRLVEVTLRTLEDRSQPDYSEISFRVCPRY